MTRATLSADLLDNRAQGSEYLSTDKEVDRDLLLHYMYKSTLNGNFSCPFDNTMEKCLEIGYSSGYWMMEMATDFPKCQFHGIDIEPRAPDLVYPKNCFFGQGNYLKGLPYEDGTFNVVHFKSLSTIGTTDQILFLLSEAFRVTKKGGFVEFLEPDYNPGHLSPLLGKLMKIYVSDRVIDRKIDDMLTEVGFTNVSNNKVAIPLGRGNMVGEFSLAVLKLFIETVDTRTKSKLNLRDEDDLLYLIEKECEQYNSHINIFSGFGQKF